jgi:hypothetical protein
MAHPDKRLERMRQNPRGDWTIQDIEAVCRSYGITCSPPRRGDHYKLPHPSRRDILTIPARRPIKPAYIRDFVDLVDLISQ